MTAGNNWSFSFLVSLAVAYGYSGPRVGHPQYTDNNTGVEVFIGSKVQCLFCFETSTTEGRGEEMGGSAKYQIKSQQNL